METIYHDNGKIKQITYKKDGKLHRDYDDPALIEYYENGNMKKRGWYQNDKLSRTYDHEDFYHFGEGFALEEFYENGNLKEKEWYSGGYFIKKSYYETEDKQIPHYMFRNGKKIRIDEPILEEFGNDDKKIYKNGLIIESIEHYDGEEEGEEKMTHHCWFENGKLSKDIEPASIQYFDNGNIWLKQWFKDEVPYSENEIIEEKYYKSGDIQERKWLKSGKRFKNDEPTIEEYYENGNISKKHWTTANGTKSEEYYENGSIKSKSERDSKNNYTIEEFYENEKIKEKIVGKRVGFKNMEDETIKELYNINGIIQVREFKRNYKFHNYESKPAVEIYNNEGVLVDQKFYTNGIKQEIMT